MASTPGLARQATYLVPLMIAVTLFGFWPSYFAQLSETRLSVHLHSTLMITWLAMLLTQAILVRRGQIGPHRNIGRVSLALAPLMVVTGLFVTREFVGRSASDLPRHALQIFTLSVCSILHFALTYGLAICYRRRTDVHGRFMIATGLILLGPALLRVFSNWVTWTRDVASSGHASLGALELSAVALILIDLRRGRVWAPYVVTLILFFCEHALFLRASDWGWWRRIALWMAA
jgi:uncharacterized membrane protein